MFMLTRLIQESLDYFIFLLTTIGPRQPFTMLKQPFKSLLLSRSNGADPHSATSQANLYAEDVSCPRQWGKTL